MEPKNLHLKKSNAWNHSYLFYSYTAKVATCTPIELLRVMRCWLSTVASYLYSYAADFFKMENKCFPLCNTCYNFSKCSIRNSWNIAVSFVIISRVITVCSSFTWDVGNLFSKLSLYLVQFCENYICFKLTDNNPI